jgi:rRNA maturation endonuclease Nob1
MAKKTKKTSKSPVRIICNVCKIRLVFLEDKKCCGLCGSEDVVKTAWS